ncbi:DNA replication complex GINS protein SLD5 [Eumeta japonica]|uniref:DNA replication complex GINS protein SLD5 n=1 Tax=Eumeta variegata TaxID=151549 RepID=A0A4C1XIJ1_EUMVA|nr:DNA replication complex GINS protein SLD5 [Eumeta japonica]
MTSEENIEFDGSDEEEEVTAEAVLKIIQTAWQNERLAPEILQHNSDMVDCMLRQMQHMEYNINKLPKTDLRYSVHKMEISRIKFIISNYLLTRITKIEKYCISVLNDEQHRMEVGTNYLTPSEYKYAKDYLLNLENHMKNIVLNKMPANFQTFDKTKLLTLPNLHTHVFLKANETVNGVVAEGLTDQDEEIDLEEGSQHILQYKPIADLLKAGKVQLI